MKLVSCGHGNRFNPDRFRPIQNKRDSWKPSGGLWTSPVDSECGWKHWCEGNKFGIDESQFEVDFEGRLLFIESIEDAKRLPLICHEYLSSVKFVDYEKASTWYDAIYLTEKGLRAVRFDYMPIYGWDCETVLILNKGSITPVEATIKGVNQ